MKTKVLPDKKMIEQELYDAINTKLDHVEAGLNRINDQSGELRKRLLDARQKATEWCNLAMEMVSELRQDYPPGEKTELDGVEMIRTLRRKIRELETSIKLSNEMMKPSVCGHPIMFLRQVDEGEVTCELCDEILERLLGKE